MNPRGLRFQAEQPAPGNFQGDHPCPLGSPTIRAATKALIRVPCCQGWAPQLG